jgi:hypothetical protein
MNLKDRRVHLFLQIFFLLLGLYQLIKLTGLLQSGSLSATLFEYQEGYLPFITISATMLSALTALITSFALWTRTAWAYGFALFSSGILFMYHFLGLAKAIGDNSFEIIPAVLVLIILLQSFPYLLRRSYRGT